MKFFYFAIASLLFFNKTSCIQQKFDFFTRQKYSQEESEFQKIEKMGIKNRKLYSAYYGKNEKLPAVKTLVEEVVFNSYGLPAEKIYYDSYKAVKTKYIYEYNQKKDLIKEEVYNAYGNITFRREISYTPNTDTSVVLITDIKKGKKRNTYNYDEKDRLIVKMGYDSGDKVYLSQNYIYEGDNLKTIRFIDGEGKKLDEIEFTYNKLGNLYTEVRNKIITKYLYDEKNRLNKVESNYGNIRTYQYNDNNYIVEDQFYLEFKKRQFKLVFSYLKNGLTNEVIRYDPDDKKVFYSKYTYE